MSPSTRAPGSARRRPPATGPAVNAIELPGGIELPGIPGWPDWPDWPGWPWPPCHLAGGCAPRNGVGLPRSPSLGIATPPEAAGGGGSGGGIGIRPRTIEPAEPGEPGEPGVVNADTGAVVPGSLEPVPITMPPLIGLPPVVEVPLRPPAAGGSSAAEPVPRGGPGRESVTGRERPPATSAGAGTEPSVSTRVGYPKYLRDAKVGEVAALALPGFAGILALTALGGFLGYRQAKAGHVVRAAGTSRFLR
ncbi:hypothetical protein ACXDF8_00865 [Mycolicibacterium sp. CBM1]